MSAKGDLEEENVAILNRGASYLILGFQGLSAPPMVNKFIDIRTIGGIQTFAGVDIADWGCEIDNANN